MDRWGSVFLVYNSVRCRYRQQWANQLDKILPTGEKLKQWSIKDDLRCYNTSPPKMLRPHALNTMQTVRNRSGVDGRSGKFESGISKPGNRLVSGGGAPLPKVSDAPPMRGPSPPSQLMAVCLWFRCSILAIISSGFPSHPSVCPNHLPRRSQPHVGGMVTHPSPAFLPISSLAHCLRSNPMQLPLGILNIK